MCRLGELWTGQCNCPDTEGKGPAAGHFWILKCLNKSSVTVPGQHLQNNSEVGSTFWGTGQGSRMICLAYWIPWVIFQVLLPTITLAAQSLTHWSQVWFPFAYVYIHSQLWSQLNWGVPSIPLPGPPSNRIPNCWVSRLSPGGWAHDPYNCANHSPCYPCSTLASKGPLITVYI